MIISIANSGKSPLSPLFQRGELAVERAELPNTYRAKLYLPSWIIPPLKKGDKKGDLNFFTASGMDAKCNVWHPIQKANVDLNRVTAGANDQNYLT
jgi:hypothetical protein